MWHATRFIESAAKVRCQCAVCARPYWLPPSKAPKYLTCGDECAARRRMALAQGRARGCATCGGMFTPRQAQIEAGQGRFCSQRCNTAGREAMLAPEARARSTEGFRRALESGSYVPATGPANPTWKGGEAARRERETASGKRAALTRDWRRRNPEQAREATKRRLGLKRGRLPKGTVKRIAEAQRWKCAACACSIREAYHVDHREPLARGGKHEPGNIQLLCPTCNVRKAAKDPIAFMQERGFLL